MARFVPFVACLVVSLGCSSSQTEVVETDSGPVTKTQSACEPEPGEDCTKCIQNIGTCCYEDPQIEGRTPMLVARCDSVPSCRACCNECARMTCAELLAANDCPNK